MVDLSNDNNWIEIFSTTQLLSGTPSKSNRLPRFYFPIPFLTPYFKVYSQCFDSPTTWEFGGYLSIYIGSITTSQPVFLKAEKVYLNMWKIIHFPDIALTQQSHLEYATPFWFPNINVQIYQYQEI